MKLLALLITFFISFAAEAATYSWTDSSGTVNFTDDPGSIPAQYRKKAIQQATEEDFSDQAPAITSPPSQPDTKTAVPENKNVNINSNTSPKVQQQSVLTENKKISPSTRFGERTAEEWQSKFRALRAELASIEQKQKELRLEAGDGKKFLTKAQANDINARNKQLIEAFETARLSFNSLVEEANKVGLPPEFAQ